MESGEMRNSSRTKSRLLSSRLNDSKGQFAIEAVLLLTISLMGFMALIKGVKDQGLIENIFTKPWVKISGMIENGAWGDPNRTRSVHPHNWKTVATLQQKN
jgi:hypothetical protein